MYLFRLLSSKQGRKSLKLKENLPDDFTVTHHAGALNTPPNTLESIIKSAEFGAQIVEFDVTFRPSGTAVIIHSSAPKEDEGELLESALKVIAEYEKVQINLDIKSTANLPEVDRLVEKYGLTERVFYTGVFEDWVPAVKNSSAIPYYLNCSTPPTKNKEKYVILAEKVKSLGAIGVNMMFKFANKNLVDVMHANGLLVSLWTVNKKKDMVKVFLLAPDNMTTKRPDIAETLK